MPSGAFGCQCSEIWTWKALDQRQPESELEKVSPEGPCFFVYDLAECKMQMETEAAARCDPRQVWGLAELTPSWPKKASMMPKRASSPPNQIRSRRDHGVCVMENGDVSYQEGSGKRCPEPGEIAAGGRRPPECFLLWPPDRWEHGLLTSGPLQTKSPSTSVSSILASESGGISPVTAYTAAY
ncbi:hypothetical protein JEQ12_011345 [Ovis aries]|uniref:Uncharacterized protein n=1 Tax=Ovis aries TaxID=9940 RepID=A0A836CT50_SHEEP|nr:hypothetical protein JEQ12_011345 [Ovis aries]